ncbi:sushi, von Willebrand factor type A, EGF and pentraxin domain-containing protein 1 [Trichonephila inaurata madagascariensis]|uniref:Sushi, von Willebrand factor type A, EGF and pentraxin domain-containing protein 1 n=1 Tax=Trichonephila inaurata madagascariensis TaxID=2747483 RepID=A0A8X7C6K9_9ARAC|nr:sushi, von Willebrand factor type A, EGF and pentraxin domain-containing protein 1 [Trichonephila inaurata madagascariensis]
MGKCFVRCRIGYVIEGINYTICQNNGKWGAFPACQKISCPVLDFSYTPWKGECVGNFYEDTCFLSCKEGGELLGRTKVTCELRGEWSVFPHCTCPVPNSSNNLVFKNNCTAKNPDEYCYVECRNHWKLIGDDAVLCQKNRKWSFMPKCIPKICPSPNIPVYLEIKENCSSIKIGEYCEVSCKHGGQVIGTSNEKNLLRCLENLEWSSPPDCSCPHPNVTRLFVEDEDCSFKLVGEFCKLRCKSKSLFEQLRCTEKREWTPVPLDNCPLTLCDDPVLPPYLSGECGPRKIGQTCDLGCKTGAKIYNWYTYIQCLIGARWSAIPDCTCPPLKVTNNFEMLQDCSEKSLYSDCKIKCKSTNRNVTLNCGENRNWPPLPDCPSDGCDVPLLPAYLTGKCGPKKVGERCTFDCRTRGKIVGYNYIQF